MKIWMIRSYFILPWTQVIFMLFFFEHSPSQQHPISHLLTVTSQVQGLTSWNCGKRWLVTCCNELGTAYVASNPDRGFTLDPIPKERMLAQINTKEKSTGITIVEIISSDTLDMFTWQWNSLLTVYTFHMRSSTRCVILLVRYEFAIINKFVRFIYFSVRWFANFNQVQVLLRYALVQCKHYNNRNYGFQLHLLSLYARNGYN